MANLHVIVITVILASATKAVTGVTGAPGPPTPCSSDKFCPDNEFCRVHLKVCASCVACEHENREPPRANKCAKSSSECGPCRLGSEEVGGICVEKADEGQTDGDLTKTKANTPLWAIITGAVIVGVLVLAMGTFMWRCRIPRSLFGRFRRLDVEANSDHAKPSSPASAPPEYHHRPPPYNQDHNYGGIARPMNIPLLALSPEEFSPRQRQQNATMSIPFQLGNGPTPTVVSFMQDHHHVEEQQGNAEADQPEPDLDGNYENGQLEEEMEDANDGDFNNNDDDGGIFFELEMNAIIGIVNNPAPDNNNPPALDVSMEESFMDLSSFFNPPSLSNSPRPSQDSTMDSGTGTGTEEDYEDQDMQPGEVPNDEVPNQNVSRISIDNDSLYNDDIPDIENSQF